MRNTTNLRRGDGREVRHVAGSRKTDQTVTVGFEPRDDVSQFLQNAVVDRFVRERAAVSDVLAAAPLEEEVERDIRVLPAPAESIVATPSVKLPQWKRILDLVMISLTLPFWLPLMLVIMLVVKATSAGPIFYRQERIGYRGRRFMIFKFRTMKVNVDTRVHESHLERLIASDSPMTKLDAHGDPRLIKGGRFLRSAGLDELPQIFNVLRGEMSLVGARPCTVHEFDRYQPWQRERVNCPPGMTGYWQVSGKNKTTFSEMIEMDIFYGKNMSAGFDLSIILRTIPAIVVQVLETRGVASWWKRMEKPKVAHLS